MKTKLLLVTVFVITFLTPQISHAKLCSEVFREIATAEANLAIALDVFNATGNFNVVLNARRILAVAQKQLKGCTRESESLPGS